MFASALAVRGRQRPRHLYPSQIKKFDFDSFSQSPLFSNPFDGMARGLHKRQIPHPRNRDQACRLCSYAYETQFPYQLVTASLPPVSIAISSLLLFGVFRQCITTSMFITNRPSCVSPSSSHVDHYGGREIYNLIKLRMKSHRPLLEGT
jgi:hypothetical protein